MKSFIAVLSLVGMASAVDVVLYPSSNSTCSGSALVCAGIRPNVCCALSVSFESVALRNVPSNWALQARAYRDRCTGAGTALRTTVCSSVAGLGLTSVALTAAATTANKRAARSAECARPDTLVLADGTAYDLTGLSDGDFEHL